MEGVSVMKKYMYYVVVAVVACLVGGGVTFAYLKSTPKEINSTKNEYKEEENKQSKSINDSEVKNKLYSLLTSASDGRVYQKTKTTSSNLSDEKKVLGTINYLVLNQESLVNFANGKYSISLENVKKYVKILFNTEIESNPEAVASIYSQTPLVVLEGQNYVFNLEFYDDGTTPVVPVKQTFLDPDVIYDRVEINDDEVYLYDKTILNNSIDWSNTGYGEISKFDGTGKVEEDGSLLEIKDYFKKYPDYFTEYKHTFKINDDGTYTYVASEPVKD